MSVWGAIQTFLTADVTLAGMLPTALQNPNGSILYGRLIPHTIFPFIGFACEGSGRPLQYEGPKNTGNPYAEYPAVTFHIWSETPDQNNAIVKRLVAILDPLTSKSTPTLVIDDAMFLGMERTTPIDWLILEEKADENANDLWHGLVGYNVWLQRSI